MTRAEVKVDGGTVGKIGPGLLILFAVHQEDTPEKTVWMVQKLAQLRIFADAQDKMNLSLKETQGEALIVSIHAVWKLSSGLQTRFFCRSASRESAGDL